MDLSALVKEYGSQAALAKAVGCDKQQINRVLKRRRALGPTLAVRIYNATGHRLGPLAEDRAA